MNGLTERVRIAPVLRRAPALRDEILAALERIPELERGLESARSAYRAEEARLRGVHRQALCERDDEIERLEGRVRDKDFELAGTHEALRRETERAEQVEAAAQEWAEAWDATHGLTFTGVGPFPEIERRDRAEHALRAALAPTSGEEGQG